MAIERKLYRTQQINPLIEKITSSIKKNGSRAREKWIGMDTVEKHALTVQQDVDNLSAEEIENNFLNLASKYYRTGALLTSKSISGIYIENKKFKNDFIDATLTLLISKARQESTGKHDRKKELMQIRAVYHNLTLDHAAMVTGAGKTTVGIPAGSAILALTTPLSQLKTHGVIASSSDDATTTELAKKVEIYTEFIRETLNKHPNPLLKQAISGKLKTSQPEPEEKPPAREKDLRSFFQQDLDYLWQSKLDGTNIGFRNHSSIIFNSTLVYEGVLDRLLFPADSVSKKERKKNLSNLANAFRLTAQAMKKTNPIYIMDEVHLPNEAPHIVTLPQPEKTKKPIILFDSEGQLQTISEFILLRLIQPKLNNPELFEKSGDRFYLRPNGRRELLKIKYNLHQYKNEVNRILQEEVNQACSFKDPHWKKKLSNYFFDQWQRNGQTNKIDASEFELSGQLKRSEKIDLEDQQFLTYVEKFLNITRSLKKGIHFLTPEMLRDKIRGINLLKHKFSEDIPFYLNTQMGKLKFPEENRLQVEISFPTWLALVAQGKIIGLSNDLFFTDPWTGDREMTPLGRILETYSDGYVVDLAPKEKPYSMPNAIITLDHQSLVNRVVKDIYSKLIEGKKRPEMVVCWDEELGFEIFNKLKKRGMKVALINSLTSEKKADTYHNKFSNYEFDVLVTTGRKSFAADFKDRKNEFTDFRVNVLNPETNFQVGQAFGRRRLEKSLKDLSLFFDQNFLLDMGTILDHKQKFYFIPFLKPDNFDDFRALVKRSANGTNLTLNNEEKLNKIISNILKRNQIRNVGDWEKTVKYESLFIRNIAPMIRQAKRQIFDRVYNQSESRLKQTIEKTVDLSLQKNNLGDLPTKIIEEIKSTLKSEAKSNFSAIEETIKYHYQDLLRNLPLLVDLNGNDLAQQKWLIQQMEKYVIREFWSEWWHQLQDANSDYINHTLSRNLKESLNQENAMHKFIRDQLKEKDIDMEKLDAKFILFSPGFKPDLTKGYSFPKLPKNSQEQLGCRNQRFFLKNGVTYFWDEDTKKYSTVSKTQFEKELASLNPGEFEEIAFKDKKFLDLYYPVENTTIFIRVILKP